MAWGETHNRFFFYSAGPFNGDGQNRPNVDARFDLIGRVVVHPLATTELREKTLQDMQVGMSGRYGSRDRKWVDYDYPTMTTQGAFPFWSPTYTRWRRRTWSSAIRPWLRSPRPEPSWFFERAKPFSHSLT